MPFHIKTSDICECTIFCGPAEVVQHDVVVAAAEHPALHQAELLSSGQLPLAGETGETGQVVDAAPRPAHPVTGIHLPATLGTLSAKPTVRKKNEGEGYTDINCIFIRDPTPYMIGSFSMPSYFMDNHIILKIHIIIDGNTDILYLFFVILIQKQCFVSDLLGMTLIKIPLCVFG